MPVLQSDTAPTDTLLGALLLATTGGLLDAVVYILHGHVFANAMTGNVILLGISAFSHNWLQALRHLAPIGAFLVGVAASRLLRTRPRFDATTTVLILEGIVLFAAGLLPRSYPDMAFTAMIAFVSAFQVSTFRTVGRFSYNSTFITGNLRDLTDGFTRYFLDTDPVTRYAELAKSRKLTAICVCFLGGAMLGAWAAPHFGNRTLWFAEPLLLLTLVRFLVVSPGVSTLQ